MAAKKKTAAKRTGSTATKTLARRKIGVGAKARAGAKSAGKKVSKRANPTTLSHQKDGPFVDRYEGAGVMCTGRYTNGQKAGTWRYYLRNGQLRAVGKFVDGKMEGAWKWWRENGELWQVGKFVADTKTGVFKRYHPNGELLDEGSYRANKKVGVWRVYTAKGVLSKTQRHADGSIP